MNNIRETIALMIAPELGERRDEALRLAQTDPLTGIGNRGAFNRATAEGIPTGNLVILFDLNNFGRVNKDEGHDTGDVILKDYSAVIERTARAFRARAFRYGGDEFAVIVKGNFAEAVRGTVERRAVAVGYKGYEVSISGEIGVTVKDADSRLQARKALRKGVQ